MLLYKFFLVVSALYIGTVVHVSCEIYGEFNINTLDVDNTNGFVIESTTANEWIGYEISDAGDVNGDGYEDMLIGAFKYGWSVDWTGRAYLVMGQGNISTPVSIDPSISELQIYRFEGDDYDQLGFAVSEAGDFNNDGYDDFMISAGNCFDANCHGADGPNDFREDCGEVYVIWGGSNVDYNNIAFPTEDLLDEAKNGNAEYGFLFYGGDTDDLLGYSVSSLGDVNGDGIDDIAVSGVNLDGLGLNHGGFHILYGNNQSYFAMKQGSGDAKLMSNVTFLFGDTSANDGYFVAKPAFDINNDGIGDIIIGLQKANGDGSKAGEVLLVFGKHPYWSGVVDLEDEIGEDSVIRFNGIDNNDFCGRDVAGVQDVNGDNIDDFLVGCDKADAGGADSGEVFLIFGREDWSVFEDGRIDEAPDYVQFIGVSAGDQLGKHVAGIGDVNGDNIPDFALGGQKGEGLCLDEVTHGEGIIIFGRSNHTWSTIYDGDYLQHQDVLKRTWIDGPLDSTALFGHRVDQIGDFNGDGYTDIVGTAYKYGSDDNGKVYVMFGPFGNQAQCEALSADFAFSNFTTSVYVDACTHEKNIGKLSCEETYEQLQPNYTGIYECSAETNGIWIDQASEADFACVPIDDCYSNPCQNFGTCQDEGIASYSCICLSSFYGTNCELNSTSCDSNPCQNSATCSENSGDYNCTCASGYEGDLCQTDIDDCASNPCQNGGTCSDTGANSFSCDCTALGFEGDLCQSDIDDCASNPCQNGGICADEGANAFSCNCTGIGYEGDLCQTDIDDCASNPCQNGGTCSDTGANSFSCDCTALGFEGDLCQSDIDDCASNPCQNGGICADEGANAFSCNCTGIGYEGDLCQTDIDDCASNPCQNGGTCSDTGANSFSCDCTALGFEGDLCQSDIDECASNPCVNGVCIDELLGYSCDCIDSGYTGALCEVDVDDCASSPCINGVCSDIGANVFECDCGNTGYEGDLCQSDIDDCASNPCQNGGICADEGLNAFSCNCTGTNHQGALCSSIINTNVLCSETQCYNDGTCIDTDDGFYCECGDGFSGIQCELDVNECDSNPCGEYTCFEDAIGSYACEYPPGIIMNAPSEVGGCAILTMDASATTSLTDSYTVNWDAMFVTYPDDFNVQMLLDLDALMSSFENSLVANINSSLSLIPDITYRFSMEVTNSYGLNSFYQVDIYVTPFPIPSLSIIVPNGIQRGVDFTLQSSVVYSDCFPRGNEVTYSWAISDGSITLDPVTQSSPNLYVPAFTLQVSFFYFFTLTADFEGAGSTSAATIVILTASNPVALISGGDRLVSALETTYLNASLSYDPDLFPASSNGLTFQWSCVFADSSQDCGFTSNDYSNTDTSDVLEIAPGLLSENFAYEFTVVVTRTNGGLSSSSSVRIDVEANPVIDVAINMIEPSATGATPELVWKNSKLSLEGTATWDSSDTSGFIYEWSVASSDTPINMSLVSSSLYTPYLVWNCDTLPLGSITFQLTVTDISTNTLGVSTKTFSIVDDAPTSSEDVPGTVTPMTGGIAYETVYSIAALGWNSNAPPNVAQYLQYQIRYRDATLGNDATEIILSELKYSNALDIYLPAGNLTIVIMVYDSLGVYARYEIPNVIVGESSAFSDDASAVCYTGNSTILNDAINALETSRSLNLITQFANELYFTENFDPFITYSCNNAQYMVAQDHVPNWNTNIETLLGYMVLSPADTELVAQALISLVNINPTLNITVGLDAIFDSLFNNVGTCDDNIQDLIVRVLESLLLSASCDAQHLVEEYLEQLMEYDLSSALPGEDPINYVTDVFTALTASLYPGQNSSIEFNNGVTITLPESTSSTAATLTVVQFNANSTLCFGNTSDIISDIVDITFGEDSLSGDGFTFTMEPGVSITDLFIGECGEPVQSILCSFYDENTGDWSQEGCETTYTEEGIVECWCTHTTAFGLLLAESINEDCIDYSDQVVALFWQFAILYFLTLCIAIIQMVRIIQAQVKISASVMYQTEHLIIILICLIRVISLIFKALETEVTAFVNVIFLVAPASLSYVGFTFVVASWAAIYHYSMRRKNSFFEPLKKPFMIVNLVILIVLTSVVAAVVAIDDDDSQVLAAQVGEGFVALINLISSIAFGIYGYRMYKTLTAGSMGGSKSHRKPWMQRTENRILIASSLFCICYSTQAVLSMIEVIQEFDLSYTAIILFFTFEILSLWGMLYLFRQGIESAIKKSKTLNSRGTTDLRSHTSKTIGQTELSKIPALPVTEAPKLIGDDIKASDDFAVSDVEVVSGPVVRERLDGEGLITTCDNDQSLQRPPRPDEDIVYEEF